MNVTKELKLVLGRKENIEGKGENAVYQHFLLFPQCFQNASFTEVLKVKSCGKGLIYLQRYNVRRRYYCLYCIRV